MNRRKRRSKGLIQALNTRTTLLDKTINKEGSDELCGLMELLKIKVTATAIDCNSTAIALRGSFVLEDERFTEKDYRDMIDMWICIEDEKELIDAICEEEMEELETNTNTAALDSVDDDNEPKFMGVSIDESDIFSYIGAVEVLQKLEQSAPKLGVNAAATVHLDQFLRAPHTGHAKQDTTLHAYFAKKYS